MEIVYVYQRKRREFGRQPLFRDKQAELFVNILPDPGYMVGNYVTKNPCHTGSSCIPEMSEHEVNTESHAVSSKGILHREGGWPKDVDSTDAEHVLRYRKKVEKQEEYIKKIKELSDRAEHFVKQNNALNIYEEYFPKSSSEDVFLGAESSWAKTLNVFRDPNPVKRAIASISWFPENGRKIAAAYSNLQFQKDPSNMSYESYVWDVENPNIPDQKITPSSPLACLKYNPKDSHMLVGGMYNGIIGCWDTRKGPHPVETSLVEKSHREPITSLAWQNSKTGSEFFSTSCDGQVLWWDVRKLSEPLETLPLDPDKNGNLVGGAVLDFESTLPTKFMVGSDNGNVYLCNKKSKTPSERISHCFSSHHSSITALQRNPFFPKNFLSAGDWSVKIWVDDIKIPIMPTKYCKSYVSDACWSPTRPAVFCAGKRDGTVDFWDLIFKQNSPTLTIQASNYPLSCVKIQDHGKLTAIGDQNGSITIAEISEGLSRIQNSEKSVFSQMLEREAKREKALEAAAKEKRLKAQNKKAESAKDLSLHRSPDVKRLEEEFFGEVAK